MRRCWHPRWRAAHTLRRVPGGSHSGLGLDSGAGEPNRRGLVRVGHLQVAGEGGEHGGGVVGPPGGADVDLGTAADPVLLQESRQA